VQSVHLERAGEQTQLDFVPSALSMAQGRELIGILTGVTPDCRPQSIGISPTLRWSAKAEKQVEGTDSGVGPWLDFGAILLKCMLKSHFLMLCMNFKNRKIFLKE
jgi:hypothetical protein